MKINFIDIWYGDILPENPEMTDYWAILTKEERQKASGFTHSILQKKYIKTRGILRNILASYLDIEPQIIIIKTSEYGKPFIVKKELYFNLSHTNNRYVVVVSNVRDVGVDLEQSRARVNLSALVNRCFSESERHYWHNLTKDQKISTFYKFWVRKEAFVKAIGRGIAVGLDQCAIDPNNHNQFLCIPEDYGSPSDWNILDIDLSEKDICAVVTKAKNFKYKQTDLKYERTGI